MRLIAENLGGERGGETVFSGIEFALETGEALVVTGPNGAGKSTLLRVIAGLLPPAEGKVKVEGGGDEFPSVASASHYLGHLNAMKTALSVEENLGFWRAFQGETGLSVGQA
ncbi:MAG: ATP-binding cassette domain-containing protein, partial [Mesorhizobium sp.]